MKNKRKMFGVGTLKDHIVVISFNVQNQCLNHMISEQLNSSI